MIMIYTKHVINNENKILIIIKNIIISNINNNNNNNNYADRHNPLSEVGSFVIRLINLFNLMV